MSLITTPGLKSGANGCVFWPPPATKEHNDLEGDKKYLVKFVMYDEPTSKQLTAVSEQSRKDFQRYAHQTQKEVKVGSVIRQIDPNARYLAGIWDPYPTLDLRDPLVQKRCGQIDTFHYFPENFRAFILPFRGTPLDDTLEVYLEQKKRFNWTRTWKSAFLDMAQGLVLMHDNNLAHLDIHEGNYLVSQGTDGNYQATLIDFDRVVSSKETRFVNKIEAIAVEQMGTLEAWFKDRRYQFGFEKNLGRLPPEVTRFEIIQGYKFKGRPPTALLPMQWKILSDYLVDARIIDEKFANKIKRYWQESQRATPILSWDETRQYVGAMDIFALGVLWLKIVCLTNRLLDNFSATEKGKFLSFVLTQMLNPNPTLRPSARKCVEFMQSLSVSEDRKTASSVSNSGDRKTRNDYLKFAKQRAMQYLENDDKENAVASLLSDFRKWKIYNEPSASFAMLMTAAQDPSMVDKEFIMGFK